METLWAWLRKSDRFSTCFQFVKRMNGNFARQIAWASEKLASNSWSVWMETKPFQGIEREYIVLASNSWSVWMETVMIGPISSPLAQGLASNSWSVWMETWNSFLLQVLQLLLASNSWSVWMETVLCYFVPAQPTNLASNSWSVWMETIRAD